MGQVINIQEYKKQIANLLAEYPHLECPKCETLTAPIKVDSEGAVWHQCVNKGHRKLSWRIAADGTMLSGFKGKKEYTVQI